MRIHYLTHVPHEGLGYIGRWAKVNKHKVSSTRLYKDETFPDLSDIDLLVILGGPMNVYEESKYPWLKREKTFIAKAIKGGKIVLGICLGAQLIATVLGAKVKKNKEKEIGWFPITLSGDATDSGYFEGIPNIAQVFHWHGDTFGMPGNAKRIASSRACKNQAFVYGKNVIALQFHFEITRAYIRSWRKEAGALPKGMFIQSAEEMKRSACKYIRESNRCMKVLLENIVKRHPFGLGLMGLAGVKRKSN